MSQSPQQPSLAELSLRMIELHTRSAHRETVELSLSELVRALEKAQERVLCRADTCERTDSLAEYRNLLGVKEELQKVGAQLKRALELRSSYYRY